MDEETIEVIIHPNGRVELKVFGLKGPDCATVTEALEEALGGKVDRQLTSEYYDQSAGTQNKQRLGY